MLRRMFVGTAVALTAVLVLPAPGYAAAEPDSKTPRSLYELVGQRSTDARAMRASAAVSENTLYALTPNRDAVMMFDGMNWSRIGGPAAEIHAGGGQVYATSPTTREISLYDHASATWVPIGGPFDQITVDDAGIIDAMDSNGVYEWWGEWRKIGGPASSIRSGGVGLLIATSVDTHEPYLYTSLPFLPWNRIGGPGQDFVITTPGYFYGQNSDGIYAWRGNLDWIKVGGPASKMYTGGYMVATAPCDGDVYRFLDVELRWERTGGPGKLFSVANDGTLYGLNSSGIWRKLPGGSGWTKVGGPAATFAV